MTKKELFDLLWEYPDDFIVYRRDANRSQVLITDVELVEFYDYDKVCYTRRPVILLI